MRHRRDPSDDPGWPTLLGETLDMLREPILKEQDGVFPAALARLGTADWVAVDALRARTGTGGSTPAQTGPGPAGRARTIPT